METICIRVKGAKVIDCDEHNDFKYVNAVEYRWRKYSWKVCFFSEKKSEAFQQLTCSRMK